MKTEKSINNDIKFLAKSEIRLKILSELNKKPDNVRGIAKKTNITYSSISSNIMKLEKKKYIVKSNKKYYINPMTEVFFNSIMEFKLSVDMINNYDTFWDKHNLNQLSIESIKNITDLKDSEIIETTPTDIYKTQNTIKKQMMKSTAVKAVFPYLHPDYPKLIEKILRNDGNVELIVSHKIRKELMLRINGKTRKKAMRKGKLKVYNFKEDLNLYLTICDNDISLGLFKNDGSFDQNRILISNNPKSYNWASNLFEHVKTQVEQ